MTAHEPDDPAILARAEDDLAGLGLSEYARRVVDAAPPLRPEQVAEIARLLASVPKGPAAT